MKVLSFVVFLIAIQAVISVSINAVNSAQNVGSSITSGLYAENTVSQLVTDGEQAVKAFTGGGYTGALLSQETLKRF